MSRPAFNQNIQNNISEYTVDLVENNTALQTNIPLPSLNTPSELREELPPTYDEIILDNTNNDIVPSYNEAMVMKIIEDHRKIFIGNNNIE